MEFDTVLAILDAAHRAPGPPTPLSAEQEDQMAGLSLEWFVRCLSGRACSWSRNGTSVHTCLFEAACAFRHLAFNLLARGLDPLACPYRGVRALCRAIRFADSRLVRRLLAAGVDPEESAGVGTCLRGTIVKASALAWALGMTRHKFDGPIEVLRVLLGAGVALGLDCADAAGRFNATPFRCRPEDVCRNKTALAALCEERRARAAWGELRRAWVLAVVRPATVSPA